MPAISVTILADAVAVEAVEVQPLEPRAVDQGGTNSGRKLKTTSCRVCGTRSISCVSTSSDEGSTQCRSSTTNEDGLMVQRA